MPLVTGRLIDVTGTPLFPKGAALEFSLKGPNLRGSEIFPTEPALATVLSSGDWTVNLAETTNMQFEAWYVLRIIWLSTGATLKDFPDWKIRVPESGGSFGDLTTGAFDNNRVYSSPVALDNNDNSGFQLNTVTGDLYQRRN